MNLEELEILAIKELTGLATTAEISELKKDIDGWALALGSKRRALEGEIGQLNLDTGRGNKTHPHEFPKLVRRRGLLVKEQMALNQKLSEIKKYRLEKRNLEEGTNEYKNSLLSAFVDTTRKNNFLLEGILAEIKELNKHLRYTNSGNTTTNT